MTFLLRRVSAGKQISTIIFSILFEICEAYCFPRHPMMTSWNGNIFRVTRHLYGEFTGPGEFPAQRPVTRSFDALICVWINGWVSNREAGDLRHYRAHYDVTMMHSVRPNCLYFEWMYGQTKTWKELTVALFGINWSSCSLVSWKRHCISADLRWKKNLQIFCVRLWLRR